MSTTDLLVQTHSGGISHSAETPSWVLAGLFSFVP